MERGDSGIIAGAMIPAPIHRSNVKTDKVAAMDGATKAAPPAAESAHVKTQDSPDTAEPPVEEDVALGGHSDRDHGVISRQPLGTPTLSKPMSRKSSNRLSSSPLHGSAASPILASRW